MKRKRSGFENEKDQSQEEDERNKDDFLYKKIVDGKEFNYLGKLLEQTENIMKDGVHEENFSSILNSGERIFRSFFTSGKLNLMKIVVVEPISSKNQVDEKLKATNKVENWIKEQYVSYITILIDLIMNKSTPQYVQKKILNNLFTLSKLEFHHGSKSVDHRALPPQQLLDFLSSQSFGKLITRLVHIQGNQNDDMEVTKGIIERLRDVIFSHLDLKLLLLNTLNNIIFKEENRRKKKRKKKKFRNTSSISFPFILAFIDKLVIFDKNEKEIEGKTFDFSKLFFLKFRPQQKTGSSKRKKRKMSGRRIPINLVKLDFRRTKFQSFWIGFINVLKPEHVHLKRIIFARLRDYVLPYLSDPNLVGPFIARPLDTFPVLPPGLGFEEVIISLECIFDLITKHGYSFEPYYSQLYHLINQKFFNYLLLEKASSNQQQLLELHLQRSDSFFRILFASLQSPKIPEIFIFSFIKRLFRICIFIDCPFLVRYTCFLTYRMLRSHKSLRNLVHRESVIRQTNRDEKIRLFGRKTEEDGLILTKKTSSSSSEEETNQKIDPFDENEKNLFRTKAEESCLWEIKTLENHANPKTVNIIKKFKNLLSSNSSKSSSGQSFSKAGGSLDGVMKKFGEYRKKMFFSSNMQKRSMSGWRKKEEVEEDEEEEEEIPLEYNLEKKLLPF